MSQFFYTSVDSAGDHILFRGYDKGKRFVDKIRYNPSVYLAASDGKYTALDGTKLKKFEPGGLMDCNQFLKDYKQVDNFDIYGNTNWQVQFLGDVFDKPIEFEPTLIDVTFLDIEVKSDAGFPSPRIAPQPVTAITVKSSLQDHYVTWGLGDYNAQLSELEDMKVTYVKCDDEIDLLLNFLAWWQSRYPDIITGWNSRFFDIPYLINRIKRVIGDKTAYKISPWNIIRARDIEFANSTQQVYEIRGVQQLDYLDLFKKFDGPINGAQESYKLDHILFTILGTRKLDYSEYGSLTKLYEEDHQKFIDYNIRDVQGVVQLEDKMGLIQLAIVIAFRARVNFADVFGPVGLWDALMYNELKSRDIICPPRVQGSKLGGIEGAYVKDPKIGMYDWVVSFDLNSLYPHLMMQYNMSPETIVVDTHDNISVDKLLTSPDLTIPSNRCMSATGQFFRTDIKGIIPTIVAAFYDERKVVKKEMLDAEQREEGIDKRSKNAIKEVEKEISTLNNRQHAIKILMNSLYGAMSNVHFRYFDIRIAESITISGQLTIRWAEQHINTFMNETMKTEGVDYVIAMDTDSLYLNMGPLVKLALGSNPSTSYIIKSLDQISKEVIIPILNKAYDELKDMMQAYEQKMVMAREVIAERGIWTGKKHYALNVWNNEGVQYNEPKLKIAGLESKRSSTPALCRTFIEDTLKIIMNENEQSTQAFIKDARTKFRSAPAEDVAFPRGINDLEKYHKTEGIGLLYQKGCPIAVRGALLYNNQIRKQKLDHRYELAYSGSKIKYAYLKMPNPIPENVIAFPEVLPPEFDLTDYIDYDKQFDKSYLEPIKKILTAIGWEAEYRPTLARFFSNG